MDTDQDLSNQETEVLADNVMDTIGEPQGSGEEAVNGPNPEDGEQDVLPRGVKDRLGRQEKRHQKEMRHMRAQLDALHNNMSNNQRGQEDPSMNPYGDQQLGGVDEQIQRAVNYALEHKERQERQVEQGRAQQHVSKQYQNLNDHLDKTAENYDDFDEIVRGDDMPFTNHMRDASLLLPKSGPGSAGEVLYKLGKNKSELDRIAKLHPLDQAAEMVKLSHALVSGQGEQKGNTLRTMGNIKSNPVTNSGAITDKTSVSELRKRMKANWK